MKLTNKTAVITGASRGLGQCTAQYFVREGANVVLCARSTERLKDVQNKLRPLSLAKQQVVYKTTDVSREEQIDELLDFTLSRFNSLDILVNCAGVAGPALPCLDMDWQAWKKAMEINVYGTIYPCMRVSPYMKKQGGGKIINISGGGATKPLPNLSAYATAKAGVVRFTETLAVELAPYYVDVNAVAPGVLATALVDDFMKAGESSLGRAYFSEVQKQRDNPDPALGRAASLCVYLASSESNGITGKLISAVWDPWSDFREHSRDLMETDIYTLRRIVPAERGFEWS